MLNVTTDDIRAAIQHTAELAETADRLSVAKVCDEAEQYGFSWVCVPSGFVREAKTALGATGIGIVSTVAYPYGNVPIVVAAMEAQNAINNGATRIDAVLPVGRFMEGDNDYVQKYLAALVQVCSGVPLTVILRTRTLRKHTLIELASTLCFENGAKGVKTCADSSRGGYSIAHLRSMAKIATMFSSEGSPKEVKASGGLRTRSDAEEVISLLQQFGVKCWIGTSSGPELLDHR